MRWKMDGRNRLKNIEWGVSCLLCYQQGGMTTTHMQPRHNTHKVMQRRKEEWQSGIPRSFPANVKSNILRRPSKLSERLLPVPNSKSQVIPRNPKRFHRILAQHTAQRVYHRWATHTHKCNAGRKSDRVAYLDHSLPMWTANIPRRPSKLSERLLPVPNSKSQVIPRNPKWFHRILAEHTAQRNIIGKPPATPNEVKNRWKK